MKAQREQECVRKQYQAEPCFVKFRSRRHVVKVAIHEKQRQHLSSKMKKGQRTPMQWALRSANTAVADVLGYWAYGRHVHSLKYKRISPPIQPDWQNERMLQNVHGGFDDSSSITMLSFWYSLREPMVSIKCLKMPSCSYYISLLPSSPPLS